MKKILVLFLSLFTLLSFPLFSRPVKNAPKAPTMKESPVLIITDYNGKSENKPMPAWVKYINMGRTFDLDKQMGIKDCQIFISQCPAESIEVLSNYHLQNLNQQLLAMAQSIIKTKEGENPEEKLNKALQLFSTLQVDKYDFWMKVEKRLDNEVLSSYYLGYCVFAIPNAALNSVLEQLN